MTAITLSNTATWHGQIAATAYLRGDLDLWAHHIALRDALLLQAYRLLRRAA